MSETEALLTAAVELERLAAGELEHESLHSGRLGTLENAADKLREMARTRLGEPRSGQG